MAQTQITDKNLAMSGTMPAWDGSALTSLSAANITGTLPAIDGSALTNLPAGGITEADMWRLTADFSGNATPISTNLARVGSTDFSVLGSGMSQVNGVFSFPSTGHWKIEYHCYITSTVHSQTSGGNIRTSQDGGSSFHYTTQSRSGIYDMSPSFPSEANSFATCIFDVTNVTTHKVDFVFGSGQGLEVCKGHGAFSWTYMVFIKLA